jgi:hypothetical protein
VKTLFLINSRSGSNRQRDSAAIIAKTCEWDHEIAAGPPAPRTSMASR